MKDKGAKIILIVLGIYLAIMLIIFLPGYLRNKRENLYILSGNFIKIKYENGRWKNITDSDEYKLKEFTVYEDSQYKGNYKILFSNRFYLYNLDGTSDDYDGQLFTHRGTLKLTAYGITNNSNITEADQYAIQQALSTLELEYTNQLNLFQKINLDVDNDGIIETIYCINNYYIDNLPSKVFSLVFINKNNKIEILEKNIIDSDKTYEEASFEIHQVLDIKDDKKMELLFTRNYFSQPERECAVLYNLSGKRKLINDFCS